MSQTRIIISLGRRLVAPSQSRANGRGLKLTIKWLQ